MVVADRGYKGDKCVRMPDSNISQTDTRAMNKARARHETVNNRIKNFNVLKRPFLHMHRLCLEAAVVCTQLSFNRGEKPYKVTY